MIFSPAWPSAGPTGGLGLACPALITSRIVCARAQGSAVPQERSERLLHPASSETRTLLLFGSHPRQAVVVARRIAEMRPPGRVAGWAHSRVTQTLPPPEQQSSACSWLLAGDRAALGGRVGPAVQPPVRGCALDTAVRAAKSRSTSVEGWATSCLPDSGKVAMWQTRAQEWAQLC